MIDQNIQRIFSKTSFISCLKNCVSTKCFTNSYKEPFLWLGGPGDSTGEVGFELALERTAGWSA